MKVTRNFDFDKLIRSDAASRWLNEFGRRINQSIQDGLDNSTDITGRSFKSGGEFTHKSVHDGHKHKRPLVRSGRLKNSVRKFPATIKKLSFIIKSNVKSKIKFELNNSILISKLIDGKFPNYVQVVPKNNQKKLEVDLKSFLDSVDRVASVSLDKKDGVKFNINKDVLNLSVNNTNSGDGKESLNVKFDHDLDISFNSRYLLDVASQLDGDKIEIFFNDTGSPALIKDPSDFDSIYVVMPMKG